MPEQATDIIVQRLDEQIREEEEALRRLEAVKAMIVEDGDGGTAPAPRKATTASTLQDTDDVPKRRRGRPPGSKNRPQSEIMRDKAKKGTVRRGRPKGSRNRTRTIAEHQEAERGNAQASQGNMSDAQMDAPDDLVPYREESSVTESETSPMSNNPIDQQEASVDEAMEDVAMMEELAKDDSNAELVAAIAPDIAKEVNHVMKKSAGRPFDTKNSLLDNADFNNF